MAFMIGLACSVFWVGRVDFPQKRILDLTTMEFILFVSILFSLFSFKYSDLYKQKVYDSTLIQPLLLLKIAISTFLAIVTLQFFFVSPELKVSLRTEVISFVLVSYALIIVQRYILRTFWGRNTGEWAAGNRRVIAIGAGKVGSHFARQVHSSKGLGLTLVGFLDDNPKLLHKTVEGKKVFGNIADMEWVVRENGIDEIFITISSFNHESLLDLIEKCRDTDCQINIVSRHFGVVEKRVGVAEFKDLRSVSVRGQRHGIYEKRLKRFFDLAAAILIGTLLSPIMLVCLLLIKLSSRGPIFYAPVSIGKNGKPFKFYKFRSMLNNAPNEVHKKLVKDFISGKKADGKKIPDDPRVTKVGKFMRKYSLDEFAQLINVIKGDMSLIGPRPSTTYEYEMMQPWHRRRFSVLPGMTGLWQVSGRAEVGFADMIMLDIYYIENCSFWMDLSIIMKTFGVVVQGKGGS